MDGLAFIVFLLVVAANISRAMQARRAKQAQKEGNPREQKPPPPARAATPLEPAPVPWYKQFETVATPRTPDPYHPAPAEDVHYAREALVSYAPAEEMTLATEQSDFDLDFTGEGVVKAVVYAEVFGKCKGRRR